MSAYETTTTGRRDMLTLGAAALFAAAIPWRASAQVADGAGASAPVAQLDGALLGAMKAGDSTPFARRYAALAPVIEQVFDLETVLAGSVGFSWPSLSPQQKAMLAKAFRRYTVATYVSNFDSYDGQSFEILPSVRAVGNGEVVVQTRLVRRDKAPVVLDYVMREGPAGWKVVDVLTDGSISRVAVQRSDFEELLSSGGVPALAAGLARKADSLSGGVV
ncbi:MAG TPA: ABC transporter substrate-binding protein [Acetobacteraceae bacterium]|nr:ABC transporter substrate-binding protein [Acetobacteraceae bacterium]